MKGDHLSVILGDEDVPDVGRGYLPRGFERQPSWYSGALPSDCEQEETAWHGVGVATAAVVAGASSTFRTTSLKGRACLSGPSLAINMWVLNHGHRCW